MSEAVDRGSRARAARRAVVFRALSAGRLPGPADRSLPRLRFDRVAQRLVRDLQAALVRFTSARTLLVVAVTAPLRTPARTVAQIEAQLATARGRRLDRVVCGNRVRARLLPRTHREAPRVIVFVHNPAPPPDGLFRLVAGWARGATRRPGNTRRPGTRRARRKDPAAD